jgi:peptidoglycan-N-acetylglucosamine deacetylase
MHTKTHLLLLFLSICFYLINIYLPGKDPLKRSKIFITTSWDDGHPLDLKLSSLLKDYGISGTMYVPIRNQESTVMTNEQLKNVAKDFEIGGHTFNHTTLTEVNEDRVIYELVESKNVLESIIGNEVVSFSYPRNLYNRTIVQKVKESGYKIGRTGKTFCTTMSKPFEYHPTVHALNKVLLAKGKHIVGANDHILAAKLLFSGNIFKRWDIIAKKSLDHIMENGGIWHLWGHSWEIDQNNDWPLLQNVLEYAKKEGRRYGAEFITNGMLCS